MDFLATTTAECGSPEQGGRCGFNNEFFPGVSLVRAIVKVIVGEGRDSSSTA